MRIDLGKLAFKAIFAATVFFGATVLWLMLATNAEAAGGDSLSKVPTTAPLSGVTSLLNAVTKPVGDLAQAASTAKPASNAGNAAGAPTPPAVTQVVSQTASKTVSTQATAAKLLGNGATNDNPSAPAAATKTVGVATITAPLAGAVTTTASATTQPVTSILTRTTGTATNSLGGTTLQTTSRLLRPVAATTSLLTNTLGTATTTLNPIIGTVTRTVAPLTGTVGTVTGLMPLPSLPGTSLPIFPIPPASPPPAIPIAVQPVPVLTPSGSSASLVDSGASAHVAGSFQRAQTSSGSVNPSPGHQPLPAPPAQPGNVPAEAASNSASVTAPAGASGIGSFALLALLLLIGGNARHFRYQNTRKGILLTYELPSG